MLLNYYPRWIYSYSLSVVVLRWCSVWNTCLGAGLFKSFYILRQVTFHFSILLFPFLFLFLFKLKKQGEPCKRISCHCQIGEVWEMLDVCNIIVILQRVCFRHSNSWAQVTVEKLYRCIKVSALTKIKIKLQQ